MSIETNCVCMYVCMYVNVWVYKCTYVSVCMECHSLCVCVDGVKVFSRQSGSKPSSSVAAAVRQPVPEWEESDERKEECSLWKRVQPEKRCSLVPPGSSPPLYLRPQLQQGTCSYTLAPQRDLQKLTPKTTNTTSLSVTELSLATMTTLMRAERWDGWQCGGFGRLAWMVSNTARLRWTRLIVT